MSKIKIMHLLQSDRFSGAENVVCQIIKMFQDDDSIEHIYCSQDGKIRSIIEQKQIKFYGIQNFSLGSINNAITMIKPDVIHAHDMHACFKAAICCRDIPLICHIHNNSFDSRKLNLKTFLFQVSAKKAAHIFWVSDTSYENFYYADKYRSKSSILYNIINIEDLIKKMGKDEKKYDYDIVYLGRLAPPKNPVRLLKVFKMITEINPSVRLAIIGTGEMETEVKKIAIEQKLDKNLDFLGFLDNPYKILHDSKVMIMTSLWEGTPMCSLEAMALGVPIVSTPTDGICKVVENGVTGYLSNKDDELVKYCCELMNNNAIRKMMSIASKERAKQLMNLQEYKNRIKDVYKIAVEKI